MTVFKYLPRQTGSVTVLSTMLDVALLHKKLVHARAYVDSGATVPHAKANCKAHGAVR